MKQWEERESNVFELSSLEMRDPNFREPDEQVVRLTIPLRFLEADEPASVPNSRYRTGGEGSEICFQLSSLEISEPV